MPVNVEIKARVPDPDALRTAVERRADRAVEVIFQEDVFFAAPEGRLKLRLLAPDRGELIHYHRPDQAGPKQSVYRIAPTSEPAALRAILSSVLEVTGVVRKRRLLYAWGQTRVHLDQVEGLGHFLELEVVLAEGQTAEEGERIARGILDQLGIGSDLLVEGAYVDLLRRCGRHLPDG